MRSTAPWFRDFDLIVASSVCGFLPNYELALSYLARTLSASGIFVQWDWLSTNDDESGMTPKRIAKSFGDAGLAALHVGKEFAIRIDGDDLPVVMGVASVS